MKTIDQQIISQTCRSFIIVNNDRFEGYTQLESRIENRDMKELFRQLRLQCKGFRNEWELNLAEMENAPALNTTQLSEKIYRGWLFVKKNLVCTNTKTILSACQFGEEAAKETYDNILRNTHDIPIHVVELINRQRDQLVRTIDHLQNLKNNL